MIMDSMANHCTIIPGNQIRTSESINHFSPISFNYKMNLIVGTSQYGNHNGNRGLHGLVVLNTGEYLVDSLV